MLADILPGLSNDFIINNQSAVGLVTQSCWCAAGKDQAIEDRFRYHYVVLICANVLTESNGSKLGIEYHAFWFLLIFGLYTVLIIRKHWNRCA